MARTNQTYTTPPVYTHEGGRASHISPIQELRRSVMSCLLWEDEFYENGVTIADRIKDLVDLVPLEQAVRITRESSQKMYLRHTPLYLTALICKKHNRNPMLVELVQEVLTRADAMGELISLVAKVNGVPAKVTQGQLSTTSTVQSKLAKSIQKGIARAFHKFDEYQFAKYNRETAVNLKDVVLLTHPKPRDEEEAALFKRILEDKLMTPDTWEVALSAGADKKEVFERLLVQNKLGYLAVLRNLRKMESVGVDKVLIKHAILARRGAQRVYPFRYLAAARHAVWAEKELDIALLECIKELPDAQGKTAILVDVSGSMGSKLSGKSDLSRMDAAATLAAIFPASDLRLFTFSNSLVEVPPRKGMAGIDAIVKSQPHGGTELVGAIARVEKQDRWDRMIVISDEQAFADHRSINSLGKNIEHKYMINVASAKNGIGYESWTHIDGFSENVIRYVREFEQAKD